MLHSGHTFYLYEFIFPKMQNRYFSKLHSPLCISNEHDVFHVKQNLNFRFLKSTLDFNTNSNHPNIYIYIYIYIHRYV